MQPRSQVSIEEYRIRASRLLKEIGLGNPEAAARLRHAPEWADSPVEQILAKKDAIQRKHALRAIAYEAGFPGWSALKHQLGHAFDPAALFDRSGGAFLNRWFRSHEAARESLERDGGYLFPYGKHFVVCEAGFLESFGVDPRDPDWERIGRDWAQPRDPGARRRLAARFSVIHSSV